jgi:uncharacterized protein
MQKLHKIGQLPQHAASKQVLIRNLFLMRCPSCEELLVMSDRQGIEIDYCPKCRGVWLDRGELDKIIERSTQSQSSEKYVEPKLHYKNGHNHEHYRKKKGFLGDLFDFD